MRLQLIVARWAMTQNENSFQSNMCDYKYGIWFPCTHIRMSNGDSIEKQWVFYRLNLLMHGSILQFVYFYMDCVWELCWIPIFLLIFGLCLRLNLLFLRWGKQPNSLAWDKLLILYLVAYTSVPIFFLSSSMSIVIVRLVHLFCFVGSVCSFERNLKQSIDKIWNYGHLIRH